MKYSKKLTLEITMKEFYEYAIPLVPKNILHKAIKSELYMCWNGIVNGDWGGSALDWKEIFYSNLCENGFIKQTEKCISIYGTF